MPNAPAMRAPELGARRMPVKRPGVQVMTVEYAEALSNPAATAARLAAFLGAPFDAKAAAGLVDASLRRQK